MFMKYRHVINMTIRGQRGDGRYSISGFMVNLKEFSS